MVLGEAPLFRCCSNGNNTLHWVDPLKDPSELHILQLTPDSSLPAGDAKTLVLEDSVSVMCFRKGRKGSYICAYYQGIAFLDEETGKLDVVREIIPKSERGDLRLNDGAIDAKGRFWVAEIDKKAAAMGPGNIPSSYEPKGRLWRYDPDGTLHQMESGVVCGNGIGWSPDLKTIGQKTWAYDFDLESGSISNRRVFVDFAGSDMEPDGLVMDTEGNIWMAVYGSSRVTYSPPLINKLTKGTVVFDPSGKHIRDVVLSAKAVTCPTWGGENLDVLFVTTAQDKGAGEEDEGGHVYRYVPPAGTRGQPKHEFGG
ncbi:putative sugar lactone lactonase [Lachnellula occidentalis]|uniref:Putative sugar lactone lactonase n=1 Tax=Lachnellula occidentalis TaxID=215460 RepID=A0A8H8S6X5_9HELO|nr:putative sugar lactone lactonase [Lachnellula occidentalis]